MKHEQVEKRIKHRFDELSNIFPSHITQSDPRVKIILDFFFGELKKKMILDVGCGKGRFTKILDEKGFTVVGIDFSRNLLEEAKKNILRGSFVEGSATDLPFPEETFDHIFCVEVLQHIADTETAIREMIRTLKMRGKIIIIDRNKISLNSRLLVPKIFIKKYREMTNRWMYPHDFPFTEKWFFPGEIHKIMKKYCQKTDVNYLSTCSTKREIFRSAYERFIHYAPFLGEFIVWKGIK